MSNSELFWKANQEELKRGYIEKDHAFVCLLCNKTIEKGIVYPFGDILYEASRYMELHIETEHSSVFEYLVGLDKKLTGLTDHQKNLLQLFYLGKSDQEVQKELDIGSASTIRNHRFVLKEKERQARVFLTMMELLKEKDEHAPKMVEIPKHVKMIDDRYRVTEEERIKVLNKYLKEDGRLTNFSMKEKNKIILLREIIKRFEVGKIYSEKELNLILKSVFDDFVTLRRYLIEYRLLERKPDGSAYWVK